RSKRDWSSDVCSSDLASRSTESDFPSAASEASPHPVDHASVCAAPQPGSWPDDLPGCRCPALPSGSETTASIQWLRSLPEPGGRSEERRVGKECRYRW